MFPFSTPMCAGGRVQALLWNPADKNANITLSNGNRTATATSSGAVRATAGKTTGKWYFEVTMESPPSSQQMGVGVCGPSSPIGGRPGTAADANSWGYVSFNGAIYNNAGVIAGPYGSYAVGDTLSVAFDATPAALKLWFAKNGVWLFGDPATGTAGLNLNAFITYYPVVGWDSTGLATARGNLAYVPPTGFSPYT